MYCVIYTITKPFADDFEILSNNKGFHQKLQDMVQINASTMGLTFKPSKCRSLSLLSGRPKSVEFFLTDPNSGQRVTLKTLETDSHKFLGAVVTHHNTAQDRLKFLVDKLDKKLSNLDKSSVRGSKSWQCTLNEAPPDCAQCAQVTRGPARQDGPALPEAVASRPGASPAWACSPPTSWG